jgi:hypothetical protein
MRRRRSTGGWLVVLGALLGGGVALALVWRARQEQARLPKPEGKPSAVAFAEAKRLIAEHFKGERLKFDEAFRVRPLPEGAWLVAGLAEMPQPSGPPQSREWQAEVGRTAGGRWALVQLEVDYEVVYSKHPQPEPRKFDFVDTDADDEDPFGSGTQRRWSQNDYYRSQTIDWGVDEVLADIAESVEQGPTLVVWLVDRTPSASHHRDQALDGISRAHELNSSADRAAAADGTKARLLTAVGLFGEEVVFPLDAPTDRVADLEGAMEAMDADPPCRENTFTAISAAVERYGPAAAEQGRRMSIVVVTDEAGDDEGQIEATLALVREHVAPVRVIGSRAPFGRRQIAALAYEEPLPAGVDPRRAPATMHTGPESHEPEHINLAFWNPNFGAEDAELIDSGFGPFSLVRLAEESGGRYLACRTGFPSVSSGGGYGGTSDFVHFFEPKVMRRYAPDYVSAEAYQALLEENGARAALVAAARLPRVEAMKFVRTEFARTENEADMKRQLDEAQKAAATIEPRIEALYQALKAGEGDRPKLTGLRWQAAYDLAMGRVLAAKARTEGYNAMLAQVKGGFKFTDAESDIIYLHPADSTGAGSSFDRLLKQSRTYLERVVKEHPGTPWAMLAERELSIPLGWAWAEGRVGQPAAAGTD